MINDVVKKHGAAVIAGRMNEASVQTVCNWMTRGVPIDKVIGFCAAVDWEITPNQLYPTNYPHPQDGLPEHLRQVA